MCSSDLQGQPDHQTIVHGHEAILSVGVSSRDLDQLKLLLGAHQSGPEQQQSMMASGSAQSRAVTPGSTVSGGGELTSGSWSSFKYIKAEIGHCPAFLSCDPDPGLRRIDDDPLIWDFVLNAKDSTSDQDGRIIVNFSGAATVDGPFIQIASLPGLMAQVYVVHDVAWWELKLDNSDHLLDAARKVLEALGALAALLWSWRGVLRLKGGKATEAPAAEDAAKA